MASLVVRWVMGLAWFALGAFWSIFVVCKMLYDIIRNRGVSHFFEKKYHNPLPEAAKNPKFRHDFVKTKSGTRLHCVHSGDADKPLMLCLHGFPECWYSYHYILDHFSEDFHVVAFDMRGYGDSDKPATIGEYHLHYLVRDVKELVDALGYKKATIVAHDWGGVVGWSVPNFYPEIVDKLIIMNAPHARRFMKFMKSHPSQLLKSWYIFFFQIPYLAELMIKSEDFKAIKQSFKSRGMGLRNQSKRLTEDEIGIYKQNAGMNAHYAVNYYRALNPIYSGLNLKVKSKTITQPCLVIWGKQDKALDHRLAENLEDFATNLKVHYIEECSHWVSLDQPEIAIRTMEVFLMNN